MNSSSEAVAVTEQGLAIKTRSANIRRVPESERWDADSIFQVRATPWLPDGSDNSFDIQVGMERPAEMVSSEDLPSQGRHLAVGSQRRLSRVAGI